MKHSLAGLAALLAALGCGDSPVAPNHLETGTPLAALNSNQWVPFSTTVTGCGETIVLSGEYHILGTGTNAAEGNVLVQSLSSLRATGVGTTSGATYHITIVNHAFFHWFNGGSFADANRVSIGNTLLIGEGDTPNRRVAFRLRVVHDASGELVINFNDSAITCQ